MIIDFHTHVFAPEDQIASVNTAFHGRVLAGGDNKRTPPHTIENVLEAQEVGGVDITCISNPLHGLRDHDVDGQLKMLERHNRYIAEQQDKYDNIYGFASTNPYGGDRLLREFERAVKKDGLKGAWVTSSFQGHCPDDEEAYPFYEPGH